MDVFQAIRERRSVRKYLAKEVGGKELEKVLEAANLAPSAGNLQAYAVVVVKDGKSRKALSRACGMQEHVAQAPVSIVFLSDGSRNSARYGERGRTLYAVQDATIAAAYAQLAATALGLATCWIGKLDEEEVRRAVGAPPSLVPTVLLTLGYAAEEPAAKPRRKLGDVVKRGTFIPAAPKG